MKSKLEKLIIENSNKYYEGSPEISDTVFDALLERLRVLDPDNHLLTDTGHGYDIDTDSSLLEKRNHWQDVRKFESKIRDVTKIGINPKDAVVTPKLDGGSAECYYTNGVLDYVLSRGDGVTGFDITNNLVHCIPSSIDSGFTGMVRGEVIIPTYDFKHELEYKGYKSARNASVGLSQKLKLSDTERYCLHFVAYTVMGHSTYEDISTKFNCLSWLVDNDFEVVDLLSYPTDSWDPDDIRELIKSYDRYLIDGLVITTKSLHDTDKGYVPDREIAYKIESELATTQIRSIDWQLTRTKKLTPVVNVDPVELSGATIKRATAYNFDFVQNMGLRVGALVSIQRSGEVIPKIEELIEPGDGDELPYPTVCPECGHKLVKNGTDLWCPNPECGTRSTVSQYINTVASVKGLGGSFINSFMEKFDINTIEDLYDKIKDINDDSILSIDNTGTGTLAKYYEMVDKLLGKIPFNTFLVGLNIKGLSWKAAEKINNLIVKESNSIEGFNLFRIIDESGVNSMVRDSLYKGGYALIDKLLSRSDINVILVNPDNDDKVDKIPVSFTGKLSVTRKEFESYMKDKGLDQVDIKKAKFLITNTPGSSSSKNKKANELGIPKVTEDSVRNWLDNDSELLDYEGNKVLV